MQAGDCPDAPPELANLCFRFKNMLATFSLAEHNGRFYCAPIIQCPLAGFARPFSSRPPFDSKQAAFEHARAEVMPFLDQHGGSAVKFFKVWEPEFLK